MKSENPDETLLERGLEAWDVPEPPPGLTDRILASNAEALAALCTPHTPTPDEPPALEEDPSPMLPTTPHNESSTRPFWTATALGFAAAAAIVLGFIAGRHSQPLAPPTVTPVLPTVEVRVTAPAPTLQPPAPPEPPRVPEVVPEAGATNVPGSALDTTPDLKNPFGASDDPSRPRKPDVQRKPLKDPFSKGTAVLRIGTEVGAPPAQVFVDGNPLGATPIAAHKVSPGKHTVVFQWPDKRQSMTVNLDADETRVVRGSDQ